MFQPEILQPSWPYSDKITSSLDDEVEEYGLGLVAEMSSHEFSPMDATPEASTDFSFSIQYLANIFPDEYMDFQVPLGEPTLAISTHDDFPPDLEELRNTTFTGEIDGMPLSLEDNEGSFHFRQSQLDGEDECNLRRSMNTSDISMEMASIQPRLSFPTGGMEIDNQLSLLHLLMAYGEAMQNGQRELAEVIVERISLTVSPVGDILERLLYYLFASLDKQSDYLKVESKKNFHAAFKAFYQIFPYGKFAHFAANSAILEAMPKDAEIIHIFDFDMGDGVQWSSMIEAIGHQKRELKLTSIKRSEGDSRCDPLKWKFEETKRRLHDHARSFNLNLKVDEMDLHDWSEMKNIKKRGDGQEWCAFNCMVSLPHMGRVRSRKDVIEFLRVAKEFVTYTSYKGIITFGDGDAWEKLKVSSSFTSFLDGHLVHYQTLLESLEYSFPIHFGEARTSMECLFVAPSVSSLAWVQKWEETRECCDLQSTAGLGLGLWGWKVSKESLMEAKELVREGESLYGVRIEGEHSNQLVLDWRGTELVRVSCWQS